ncbi:AAA family ATPase [Flavobacterium filum]|uniref:AAA family ATPase n=1 Tax=Flavobacterium filum TaxID=370974 RepID=UPI0023EF7E4C|nr:AAA family ATPase [Flavobacterium filum]
MNINQSNYYEAIEQIGLSKLSPALKKGHELIERVTKGNTDWSSYQTYKKVMDMQFEAVGLLIHKSEESSVKSGTKHKTENPKPKAEQKNTKKSAPVKRSSLDEEEDNWSDEVELISPEITFIKRFAGFHNKTKTKEQIGSFIRSLHKAIAERRIRKSSPHAKLINEIQKELIERYNEKGKPRPFEFTERQLQNYVKFGKAEILYPSIRFIKSFIGLNGKDITKEKAITLHDCIVTAIEKEKLSKKDKYISHINHILSVLSKFVKEGRTTLPVTEAQLNGLEGVLSGCGCKHQTTKQTLSALSGLPVNTEPRNKILNSYDVLALKTNKLNFSGKWLNFIGNPSKGFTVMIYGKPKYGKSYLAIAFAGYLARHHGKVLYVAMEEGFDDTLKQKLNDKNVAHPNLDVSDFLPKDLSPYQFVFIDSVNKAQLSADQLDILERRYPQISFAYIFQTTKDGNFKGAMEFKHNVDVVIEVPERGKAIQYGRFNQGSEMNIFE